jgi:hypothetical protein
MLNPNLTQEEAQWLLNEYAARSGGRISGETMDKYFVKARTLMMGKQAERPGCACMFKSFVMMTNSMFNQYRSEIEVVATPVVKKSGRKKKVQ